MEYESSVRVEYTRIQFLPVFLTGTSNLEPAQEHQKGAKIELQTSFQFWANFELLTLGGFNYTTTLSWSTYIGR